MKKVVNIGNGEMNVVRPKRWRFTGACACEALVLGRILLSTLDH